MASEAQRERIIDLCARLDALSNVRELADAIGASRVTYDVIVKDARIVDGTGRPAFAGDVAVQDGRIAAVGDVSGTAARTINADGQVVAPGFIDAHTHYDAQLLWDPAADPSTLHGITTILTGNCGYTLAPVRADDQDYLMGLFAAAEEIPKQALQRFAPFGWETFPQYLDWIPGRVGVNVVTQVGHSAVRRFAMGEAALERSATEEEIAEMVRIVEAAMDAGAAGISSSQAPHQRGENGEHIPSFFADDAETRALAEAVRRKGKRLLSINPATKRDGLSAEDLGSSSGLPSCRARSFRGTTSAWARRTATTRSSSWKPSCQRGNEIYAIARCQRPETRFTLKKLSAIFANSESWVELSRLDPADKIAALGDPTWRARLSEFWDTARFMVNTSVEKAASPATAPLEGRLLVDIAKERGSHLRM